jgi:DNA repair protein RadC
MTDYTTQQRPLSIKAWNEDDQPREKMLAKGKAALSDAELIAIMIGSGTVGENAIELAQRILKSVNDDLSELGRRTIKDLMKFKGIGEAKAITIVAALEMGRRRQFSDILQRNCIKCPRDTYDVMLPHLIDLQHEEFWVLLLNQANHILNKVAISKGGVTGTIVDSKIIFKHALDALATGIILVHNHPSGTLKPSQADINLTKKLKKGGQLLDITVHDHLIISNTGYFSFADEDMMHSE